MAMIRENTLTVKTISTNIKEKHGQKKNVIINGFLKQKQPSIGVLKKRCSENMQQIYRGAPMPKVS